jgi:hypothetical protein
MMKPTYRTLEGHWFHDPETKTWRLHSSLSYRQGEVHYDIQKGRYLFYFAVSDRQPLNHAGEAFYLEDALEAVKRYVTEVFQCHKCYSKHEPATARFDDAGYAYCPPCHVKSILRPGALFYATWQGDGEFYSGISNGDRIVVAPRRNQVAISGDHEDGLGPWLCLNEQQYHLLADLVEVTE